MLGGLPGPSPWRALPAGAPWPVWEGGPGSHVTEGGPWETMETATEDHLPGWLFQAVCQRHARARGCEARLPRASHPVHVATLKGVLGKAGLPCVLSEDSQGPSHGRCPLRARGHRVCDAFGLACPLQREILPSTRLGTLPPAFSTRVLPAQATEYAFAFIQVPQDVSLHVPSCQRGPSHDTAVAEGTGRN